MSPTSKDCVTWEQFSPYLSRLSVAEAVVKAQGETINRLRADMEKSQGMFRRLVLIVAVSMPSGAFGAKVLPRVPDAVVEMVGSP